MSQIILASKSQYRQQLLKNAGLSFSVSTANIDERAIEKPLLDAGLGGADIAEVLAQAKADNVSAANPSAIVIGSDQTLSLDG